MSSSTSATPTPRPFILPANHFSLSGRGVRVDFSETSISGRPLLTYQDTVRTLNFIGDDIRINEVPDIGSIVSVTLSITPDVGSTTFSVLIPHVTVSGPNGSASISTYGITTMHKMPFAPQVFLGQREVYHAVHLTGTANHVVS